VEVEQAKTQLQTTRAAAIDVGVLRAQYEHAVAILIGKPPAEFSLPPLPLTAPPPHIPISLPSELLERRPISRPRRGEWRRQCPDRSCKVRLLPLISLGASGGFESSAISTLINGPSGLWSMDYLPSEQSSMQEDAVLLTTRRVRLMTIKSPLIGRTC